MKPTLLLLIKAYRLVNVLKLLVRLLGTLWVNLVLHQKWLTT